MCAQIIDTIKRKKIIYLIFLWAGFFNRVTAVILDNVVAIDKCLTDSSSSSSRGISIARSISWRASRSAERLSEERKEGRKHFEEESTTHWLPRYAFPRSRKSVTPRLRTRSRVIYLLRRGEERGREKGRKIERMRERKTSLWWWWDPFRPGSFDASVTGASEPGTGPLVKHATMHLPWHHSLPLFPFAPFLSLLFFPHPSSTESRDLVFSLSSIIPRLAFRSRRTFGDAFQRCRRPFRPSTPSCFLLLPAIEIQRWIDFLSPLRGINPLRTFRVTFCCAIYICMYVCYIQYMYMYVCTYICIGKEISPELEKV